MLRLGRQTATANFITNRTNWMNHSLFQFNAFITAQYFWSLMGGGQARSIAKRIPEFEAEFLKQPRNSFNLKIRSFEHYKNAWIPG